MWTKAIERDLRALALKPLDVVDAACEDAMQLASGERAVERATRDARALAWAFAECARGCVTSDAFGKRAAGIRIRRRQGGDADEAVRGGGDAGRARRGDATSDGDEQKRRVRWVGVAIRCERRESSVAGRERGEVFVETGIGARRRRRDEEDDARGDGLSNAQGAEGRVRERAGGIEGGARRSIGALRSTSENVKSAPHGARRCVDYM